MTNFLALNFRWTFNENGCSLNGKLQADELTVYNYQQSQEEVKAID